MSTGRTIILQRIREALRHPAPLPAHHPTTPDETIPSSDFRPWLPQVGPTPADWLHAFHDNFAALKGRFLHAPSQSVRQEQLRQLATEQGWEKIAVPPGGPEAELARSLGIKFMELSPGYCVEELEACHAAITGCDLLVAQTGSILVTSRSCAGRALTIFPPHHVVIARVDQIVPDLPAAFAHIEKAYRDDPPSMISFITGASRTGDIERILVLGAHGPKELTVALVGAAT